MARPVIALLTDFGLRDHYVAAMKAVILDGCPDAALLDVTHDIPAQDVLAGAIELEAIAPVLPHGTVVVGVVDPGVGSGRRAVAVETERLTLVGPDNGLFSLVLRQQAMRRAIELTDNRFARPAISRTFEGRDRFAPAAAWLATGVDMATMGPACGGLVRLEVPVPVLSAEGVDGVVLRIDRFGNLVTNIPVDMLAAMRAGLTVEVGGARIPRLVATYADAPSGSLCALAGSTGALEISLTGGSAAATLKVSRGAAVCVQARPRA